MNRKTDFRERRDKVLGIVVGQYIKTVSPISSALISEEFHLDLSPATIRNILAELEEMGYLTHPHTSAGRVPTQTGYRYYVDHLMQEIELLEEEKRRIRSEYVRRVTELETLLERASAFVADLTHYTSIISVDGSDQKIFLKGTGNVPGYPEFHDLRKIRDILEILEEKERILEVINRNLRKKVEIYIGHEIACANIESCSLAISQFTTEKGATGRIAVLGPTRMDYERVVGTLEFISGLLEGKR